MDFRLPTGYRKATFRRLYGETELYRSLLQTPFLLAQGALGLA